MQAAGKQKHAVDLTMKIRRRQSDARWRANVASCYETLKNIIPVNKRASKRQISKAVVLQETHKHIDFLENVLASLLAEKAAMMPAGDKARFCDEESKRIKQEFQAKHACSMTYVPREKTRSRRTCPFTCDPQTCTDPIHSSDMVQLPAPSLWHRKSEPSEISEGTSAERSAWLDELTACNVLASFKQQHLVNQRSASLGSPSPEHHSTNPHQHKLQQLKPQPETPTVQPWSTTSQTHTAVEASGDNHSWNERVQVSRRMPVLAEMGGNYAPYPCTSKGILRGPPKLHRAPVLAPKTKGFISSALAGAPIKPQADRQKITGERNRRWSRLKPKLPHTSHDASRPISEHQESKRGTHSQGLYTQSSYSRRAQGKRPIRQSSYPKCPLGRGSISRNVENRGVHSSDSHILGLNSVCPPKQDLHSQYPESQDSEEQDSDTTDREHVSHTHSEDNNISKSRGSNSKCPYIGYQRGHTSYSKSSHGPGLHWKDSFKEVPCAKVTLSPFRTRVTQDVVSQQSYKEFSQDSCKKDKDDQTLVGQDSDISDLHVQDSESPYSSQSPGSGSKSLKSQHSDSQSSESQNLANGVSESLQSQSLHSQSSHSESSHNQDSHSQDPHSQGILGQGILGPGSESQEISDRGLDDQEATTADDIIMLEDTQCVPYASQEVTISEVTHIGSSESLSVPDTTGHSPNVYPTSQAVPDTSRGESEVTSTTGDDGSTNTCDTPRDHVNADIYCSEVEGASVQKEPCVSSRAKVTRSGEYNHVTYRSPQSVGIRTISCQIKLPEEGSQPENPTGNDSINKSVPADSSNSKLQNSVNSSAEMTINPDEQKSYAHIARSSNDGSVLKWERPAILCKASAMTRRLIHERTPYPPPRIRFTSPKSYKNETSNVGMTLSSLAELEDTPAISKQSHVTPSQRTTFIRTQNPVIPPILDASPTINGQKLVPTSQDVLSALSAQNLVPPSSQETKHVINAQNAAVTSNQETSTEIHVQNTVLPQSQDILATFNKKNPVLLQSQDSSPVAAQNSPGITCEDALPIISTENLPVPLSQDGSPTLCTLNQDVSSTFNQDENSVMEQSLDASPNSSPDENPVVEQSKVYSPNFKPDKNPVMLQSQDASSTFNSDKNPVILQSQDASPNFSPDKSPVILQSQDSSPNFNPVKSPVILQSQDSSPNFNPVKNHVILQSQDASPNFSSNKNHVILQSQDASPNFSPDKNHVILQSQDASPNFSPDKNHVILQSQDASPNFSPDKNHVILQSQDASPPNSTFSPAELLSQAATPKIKKILGGGFNEIRTMLLDRLKKSGTLADAAQRVRSGAKTAVRLDSERDKGESGLPTFRIISRRISPTGASQSKITHYKISPSDVASVERTDNVGTNKLKEDSTRNTEATSGVVHHQQACTTDASQKGDHQKQISPHRILNRTKDKDNRPINLGTLENIMTNIAPKETQKGASVRAITDKVTFVKIQASAKPYNAVHPRAKIRRLVCVKVVTQKVPSSSVITGTIKARCASNKIKTDIALGKLSQKKPASSIVEVKHTQNKLAGRTNKENQAPVGRTERITPIKLPPSSHDWPTGGTTEQKEPRVDDRWSRSNSICEEPQWISDDDDFSRKNFTTNKNLNKREQITPQSGKFAGSTSRKRKYHDEELQLLAPCTTAQLMSGLKQVKRRKTNHPRCRRSLQQCFPEQLEAGGEAGDDNSLCVMALDDLPQSNNLCQTEAGHCVHDSVLPSSDLDQMMSDGDMTYQLICPLSGQNYSLIPREVLPPVVSSDQDITDCDEELITPAVAINQQMCSAGALKAVPLTTSAIKNSKDTTYKVVDNRTKVNNSDTEENVLDLLNSLTHDMPRTDKNTTLLEETCFPCSADKALDIYSEPLQSGTIADLGLGSSIWCDPLVTAQWFNSEFNSSGSDAEEILNLTLKDYFPDVDNVISDSANPTFILDAKTYLDPMEHSGKDVLWEIVCGSSEVAENGTDKVSNNLMLENSQNPVRTGKQSETSEALTCSDIVDVALSVEESGTGSMLLTQSGGDTDTAVVSGDIYEILQDLMSDQHHTTAQSPLYLPQSGSELSEDLLCVDVQPIQPIVSQMEGDIHTATGKIYLDSGQPGIECLDYTDAEISDIPQPVEYLWETCVTAPPNTGTVPTDTVPRVWQISSALPMEHSDMAPEDTGLRSTDTALVSILPFQSLDSQTVTTSSHTSQPSDLEHINMVEDPTAFKNQPCAGTGESVQLSSQTPGHGIDVNNNHDNFFSNHGNNSVAMTTDQTVQVVPLNISCPSSDNLTSILLQTSEGEYVLEHALDANPIYIVGNDVWITGS